MKKNNVIICYEEEKENKRSVPNEYQNDWGKNENRNPKSE